MLILFILFSLPFFEWHYYPEVRQPKKTVYLGYVNEFFKTELRFFVRKLTILK